MEEKSLRGCRPPQPIESDQWQSNFCIALALLLTFIDSPDSRWPVNKYCPQKSMKAQYQLHISLFSYERTRYNHTNKEQTWKLSNLITLCARSPSFQFLSCLMFHIVGCKQPPHWLRTSLASLCRHQELSHLVRCHIRSGTQTHTYGQTLHKPTQPSGYWKDLSLWSSWRYQSTKNHIK